MIEISVMKDKVKEALILIEKQLSFVAVNIQESTQHL